MQPIAIVYYERLMPGSQVANRLHDLGYRVMTLNKLDFLVKSARKEMPMIVFAEITPGNEVLAAVTSIKADPATNHVPIVMYAPENAAAAMAAAKQAGANLVVSDSAILSHLPQWIEQVLHVD